MTSALKLHNKIFYKITLEKLRHRDNWRTEKQITQYKVRTLGDGYQHENEGRKKEYTNAPATVNTWKYEYSEGRNRNGRRQSGPKSLELARC